MFMLSEEVGVTTLFDGETYVECPYCGAKYEVDIFDKEIIEETDSTSVLCENCLQWYDIEGE